MSQAVDTSNLSLAQAQRIALIFSHIPGARITTSYNDKTDPIQLPNDPQVRALLSTLDPKAPPKPDDPPRRVVISAAGIDTTIQPRVSEEGSSSKKAYELSVQITIDDAPNGKPEPYAVPSIYQLEYSVYEDFQVGSYVWALQPDGDLDDPSLDPDAEGCEKAVYPLSTPSLEAAVSRDLTKEFESWMYEFEKNWEERAKEFDDDIFETTPFGTDEETAGWVVQGALLCLRLAVQTGKRVVYSAVLRKSVWFKGDLENDVAVLAGLVLGIYDQVRRLPSKHGKA